MLWRGCFAVTLANVDGATAVGFALVVSVVAVATIAKAAFVGSRVGAIPPVGFVVVVANCDAW